MRVIIVNENLKNCSKDSRWFASPIENVSIIRFSLDNLSIIWFFKRKFNRKTQIIDNWFPL